MPTKEEILYETHKHIHGQGLKDNQVHEAMDEYAKQESIAFYDWWNKYIKAEEEEILAMPYDEHRKKAAIDYGKLVNIPTEEKYNLYQIKRATPYSLIEK